MKNEHAHNSRSKLWLWLIVVLIVLALGLSVWAINWVTYARPPLAEAVAALAGSATVEVRQEPWLAFLPTQAEPDVGFIFYPGGRIDPRGYATLMQTIAAEGYLVVVPEMPLNMAAFDPDVAGEIMAHYPDVSRWVIGGHSVGGTMAAQYANNHRQEIAGLVIWASYPAGNADLSGTDIPVALIYGTLDPRVNDAAVSQRKHLLPADTLYVRIDGGDHHQFGTYKIDPKNDHATIGRAAQHEQIVQPTLELLKLAASS
jgi:predicted esterase